MPSTAKVRRLDLSSSPRSAVAAAANGTGASTSSHPTPTTESPQEQPSPDVAATLTDADSSGPARTDAEEGMGVDMHQGTTSSSTCTAVAGDPNTFRRRTNFEPRHGSYRTSHEKGALHYAMSLDLSDWFDDEDDSLYDEDDEHTLPPSQ